MNVLRLISQLIGIETLRLTGILVILNVSRLFKSFRRVFWSFGILGAF